MFNDNLKKEVVNAMLQRYGEENADAIQKGVEQVSNLWREEDGDKEDFKRFCLENFMVDSREKKKAFQRLEEAFEDIHGLLNEMERNLRWNIDVNTGPILKLDNYLANLNLGAHLEEDLYKSKIAFFVLLNYPVYTLDECVREGAKWSRQKWAEVRLAQYFEKRLPANIEQKIHQAFLRADNYIYNYNIYLDHVLNQEGKPLFEKETKLISHWGLRDELKAQYNEPDGFERQKLIYRVMERIIRQEIPAAVINSPEYDWNPYTNEVIGASSEPEPDERYKRLLEVFHSIRESDSYYPVYKNYIDRKFKMDREIPEERVRVLFERMLTSEEFRRTGELIGQRLGRPLEPFDIWYSGFRGSAGISEEKLDEMVSARFPDIQSFYNKIPEILMDLGFGEDRAYYIQSRIQVDPARGAGHAWGAQRKEDKAHLRTRVPEGGMDYKGYNIAIHELGHNTEQVISLNLIDHTLLEGVPNTAFTEAFAFLYQSRDIQLLGLEQNESVGKMKSLNHLWATCEIAGVALVDMDVWRWLYDHPDASPGELKDAAINIAKDVWNRFFFPVLGHKDAVILAVYSHMINSGLYLPDYPLGHIIHFQLEEYLKGKRIGEEMERMCKQGRIIPDLWMKNAVGETISVEPMLKAARESLESL